MTLIKQTIYEVRDYWRDNDLDRYYRILLLPETDEALNARMCAAFEAKFGDCSIMVIEGEAARQILTLYSLYEFTDKLLIGSFDLPNGRKLRNLLDSGIATEEELINDVLFKDMERMK